MAIRFLRFIVLLIWVLLALNFVYPFPDNVTDRQALLSFKDSITADPYGVLNSWNNSIHFCRWNGVTCSLRRQRVTSLNLSSQQLAGKLSSHIGNLSFLRGVYLYDNFFHGIIPSQIGRLFRLQYLSLTNNSFQGEFPANLSHCADIRRISVFNNNLEGKLPIEFGSWTKLNLFSLGKNHFTGSIPPSVGNMSSLSTLNLNYNNLTGVIPLELAHLAKLEILFLQENTLWGTVPLPLYNISSLHSVSLISNEFEGTLPSDFGSNLPMLREYFVANNRFSGPLPPSIGNASSLEIIEISYNNITGPVPINLGSLSNLGWLNLGRNPLVARSQPFDDLSFFDFLVNCTHLYYLGIFDSGLTGKLPTSIVNLSTTLEKISLYRNRFYGSIPREIGKLVNLTRLNLAGNFLTGTIPESVGELPNLVGLYLSDNNITGAIPTSISNITQLSVLSLETNMLQGSIPTEVFNISTLQLLNLSNNLLSGSIPEQNVGFSSQLVFLYLYRNMFTGPLPSSIGNLKQLVGLYVSNNRLTGDIPASLGDCVMLEELHMEGNLFEGRIPSSFKALQSLKIVDLSNNHISENIPRFFDELHLIEFLNLSHNRLGGEVPIKGLFSNVSRFSVTGNLRLCGGIQALQLPSCPVEILRKKKKTFPYKVILLVLIPLSILLACFAFIFYRHRKSKKINFPVPVLQENQYPRLSYKDLLLATNEFSPNNLLGEGRYGKVYQGVLEPLDHTVAVKVLDVEVRGANKSFLAECEMLRNIRHRNLIKIITACSSTDFKGNDFKALVYEFMPNGNLDNWLHQSPFCKGNEKTLTLLQRLNISIDIAMGLNYLHNHSHTSIIHCDIKPSNILLDEEFVARVGDFGLSRFSFATTLDVNQEKLSSTAVHGTVGYVPPEYGIGGKISAEGDVYSYGILLLEMFSGKKPTGSSTLLDDGNNIHNSVKNALPHRLMDIADPLMVLDQDEHGSTEIQSHNRDAMEVCLILVFEVGLLCSVATPRERIDISVAIKKLQVARDKFLHHGQ
ncbi:putative receptor-like protein kinase At3g47110 isoform X1 [Apium graveolens]|uniref:putative receptor-like protein kinase At3g47110 isoform X1 n=1 Tax=Apium graveolens TaxID=4045 RepID=UPI003D7A42A4